MDSFCITQDIDIHQFGRELFLGIGLTLSFYYYALQTLGVEGIVSLFVQEVCQTKKLIFVRFTAHN